MDFNDSSSNVTVLRFVHQEVEIDLRKFKTSSNTAIGKITRTRNSHLDEKRDGYDLEAGDCL